MAKTKTKFKGVVKGAALGFALIMAGSFLPINAMANAADYTTGDSARLNTSRIEVEGANRSFSVKRGDSVAIPEAEYVYKIDSTSKTHIIGGAKADNITESKIDVFYKATGDAVKVKDGAFVADQVGSYVVVYTVVDNGVSYEYEQLIVSEASKASFAFEQNDKNVIPSVYDVSLSNKKDVVLPLPTVKDEDGVSILTSEDEGYYVLNQAPVDVAEDTKKVYVSISLAYGSDKVSIQSREVAIEGTDDTKTEYYISGEKLSELNADEEAVLNGQDIKINYTFYQKTDNGDVFVNSTSKTFTVKTNYYYKASDKKEEGYDLVASFAGAKPDSAIVGIEKDLPTITATTGSKNTPANESVQAYYDLVVYKANANGNYNDNNDVTDKVITADGKFKAVEEGSYKFVYKVSDFYENPCSESSMTFIIKNVKDSVSATAYIYDASKDAYDSKENKYESAENLLKSQTVNRNIIMYAVGGTDNMVKRYEDLSEQEKEENANYISLKRVIRDNTNIERFVVDQQEYHAYNLIFAPGKVAGESTSVWQTIANDNYQLYVEMLKAGVTLSGDQADASIKQYLLDNNYLLVTTKFNKDVDGNEIVAGLTEDDEDALVKMRDAGYAYVAPKTANYSFENKEGTFTFYYYANDNVNNNAQGSDLFTVKLANSFEDASVPTITFSSNLQSAYLPSESISFNVATASDSIDSRLNTVTAYRYLDATKDKNPLPANEIAGTTSKLDYVVKNANTSLMKPVAEGGKWYAQEGRIQSEGWYTNSKETSYTIDLSKRPAGAGWVEILAYSIDDYGNVGFFNKIIRIADTTDNIAPVLYRVINAPEATKYNTKQIILPTLYFSDANVQYMHASVNVYKLTEDKDGNIVKTIVQESGMSTDYDTNSGYFKVDAGKFDATTDGKYQVAITVIDSGNNSITSYFNYEVEVGVEVDDPKIDNISTDPVDLEVGDAHYLVPPTWTMIKNDKYGYIGIEEQDDSCTSTYYNVSVIDAENSDYELDESYFIAKAEGSYQLQYTALLLQYKKNAVEEKEQAENGDLFFENGKLMYRTSTADYYVFIDRENGNVLAANTSLLQGEGSAISQDDMTALKALVDVFVDYSTVLIKVDGISYEVVFDNNAYSTDKYENDDPSNLPEVKIVKPSIPTPYVYMNQEKSTVTITRKSGGTTRTVATFNFAEWEKALASNTTGDFKVSGNDIYLVLKDTGEYNIKYSIQAKDVNGTDIGDAYTKSFPISSGDTENPEISINNEVLVKPKYKIGDKLIINMAGLTVKDNTTTDRDTLLSKLEVTIRNTTLNESAKTLENKSTDGGFIYELDKLETAGDYVLTFTVRDEAGNISEQTTAKFEVTTSESEPVSAKEVVGGVLIGVSVLLLVGVVGYFVLSKVKLDKKEKSYKNARKDKNRD